MRGITTVRSRSPVRRAATRAVSYCLSSCRLAPPRLASHTSLRRPPITVSSDDNIKLFGAQRVEQRGGSVGEDHSLIPSKRNLRPNEIPTMIKNIGIVFCAALATGCPTYHVRHIDTMPA